MENKGITNLLYISITSQTGGVPRHIEYALKAAAGTEYSITVAAPSDGEYSGVFRELSKDYLDLRLKPYSFRSLFVLRKYIRSHGIRIVHSHGKGAGLYSRPLKLLCPGIKVVHTFHGIYVEKYGWLLKAVYLLGEKILKRLTDAFVCVSQSEFENAMELGIAERMRAHVINNGVDTAVFCPHDIDRKSYRSAWGLEDKTFVIGCVARFDVDKGHEYLIPAFRLFHNSHPAAKLILVGDGPEKEKMEKLVAESGLAEQVVFTGLRQDVPDLLQMFNLFVSASLKEGMPYTLIEAMASGVPVVATNVIGNKDVVTDGKTGLLVEPRSSEALREGMERLYQHRELMQAIRENGPEEVKRNYSVDTSERELFRLYDQLLGV